MTHPQKLSFSGLRSIIMDDDLLKGNSNSSIDPQLQKFLETESQRQQFQYLVSMLTGNCWDMCIGDKPGSKLDEKTSTCITNCVNRLIDGSTLIIQRLQEQSKNLATGDNP
ncbi:Mitochondrial import inner membrane translocase subunit [Trichinella spiralis]|uniref:Mitochondrial import inner membrane translocase subunit n=2 Tax=Trichinella TaxID=6333 RepID=A0ABR3K838_TRISP